MTIEEKQKRIKEYCEQHTAKGKLCAGCPLMVLPIDEMCFEKSDCIFVGDSETDIRTAKNAGLKSVGVLWGFRDRKILEQEGADYIILHPDELSGILA